MCMHSYFFKKCPIATRGIESTSTVKIAPTLRTSLRITFAAVVDRKSVCIHNYDIYTTVVQTSVSYSLVHECRSCGGGGGGAVISIILIGSRM